MREGDKPLACSSCGKSFSLQPKGRVPSSAETDETRVRLHISARHACVCACARVSNATGIGKKTCAAQTFY